MRKKIVAGNWKMNLVRQEAKELLLHINTFVQAGKAPCDVIIAPPAIFLQKAVDIFMHNKVSVAAQNCSQYEEGAYTGEISAKMLKSAEVEYVILGHSERRQHFGETDEIVNQKVKKVMEHGLIPIICVGESLKEREKNQQFSVVEKQIKGVLKGITANPGGFIIAYEPVWAIGTGKNATADEAQEMHAYIRNLLANLYDQDFADGISILYGGSLKAENASEIFSKSDVDGGLVGGASLNYDEFTAIIKACK